VALLVLLAASPAAAQGRDIGPGACAVGNGQAGNSAVAIYSGEEHKAQAAESVDRACAKSVERQAR
jgi:hypothetical protein